MSSPLDPSLSARVTAEGSSAAHCGVPGVPPPPSWLGRRTRLHSSRGPLTVRCVPPRVGARAQLPGSPPKLLGISSSSRPVATHATTSTGTGPSELPPAWNALLSAVFKKDHHVGYLLLAFLGRSTMVLTSLLMSLAMPLGQVPISYADSQAPDMLSIGRQVSPGPRKSNDGGADVPSYRQDSPGVGSLLISLGMAPNDVADILASNQIPDDTEFQRLMRQVYLEVTTSAPSLTYRDPSDTTTTIDIRPSPSLTRDTQTPVFTTAAVTTLPAPSAPNTAARDNVPMYSGVLEELAPFQSYKRAQKLTLDNVAGGGFGGDGRGKSGSDGSDDGMGPFTRAQLDMLLECLKVALALCIIVPPAALLRTATTLVQTLLACLATRTDDSQAEAAAVMSPAFPAMAAFLAPGAAHQPTHPHRHHMHHASSAAPLERLFQEMLSAVSTQPAVDGKQGLAGGIQQRALLARQLECDVPLARNADDAPSTSVVAAMQQLLRHGSSVQELVDAFTQLEHRAEQAENEVARVAAKAITSAAIQAVVQQADLDTHNHHDQQQHSYAGAQQWHASQHKRPRHLSASGTGEVPWSVDNLRSSTTMLRTTSSVGTTPLPGPSAAPTPYLGPSAPSSPASLRPVIKPLPLPAWSPDLVLSPSSGRVLRPTPSHNEPPSSAGGATSPFSSVALRPVPHNWSSTGGGTASSTTPPPATQTLLRPALLQTASFTAGGASTPLSSRPRLPIPASSSFTTPSTGTRTLRAGAQQSGSLGGGVGAVMRPTPLRTTSAPGLPGLFNPNTSGSIEGLLHGEDDGLMTPLEGTDDLYRDMIGDLSSTDLTEQDLQSKASRLSVRLTVQSAISGVIAREREAEVIALANTKIKAVQEQLNKVSKDLTAQLDQNKQLESKIRRLERDHTVHEQRVLAEKWDWQQAATKAQSRVTELEGMLTKVQSDLDGKFSQVSELDRQLRSLSEDERKIMEEYLVQATARVAAGEARVSELQQTLTSCTQYYSELLRTTQEHSAALEQELRDSSLSGAQASAVLMADNAGMQAQVKQQQLELEQLQTLLEQQQLEVEQHKTAAEAQSTRETAEVTHLRAQLDEKSGAIQMLEQQLKETLQLMVQLQPHQQQPGQQGQPSVPRGLVADAVVGTAHAGTAVDGAVQLRDAVTSLTQRHAALQQQEQAAAAQVVRLQSELQLKDQVASDLQAKLQQQERLAAASAAELQATLAQQQQAAAASAEELQAKLQQQELATATKSAELEAAISSSTDLQARLQETSASLAQMIEQLSNAEARLQQTTDHLGQERAAVERLSEERSALDAQLAAQAVQVQQLSQQLEEANVKLLQMQQQWQVATAQVDDLQAQLQQQRQEGGGQLVDLQGQVRAATEAVVSLEAQLVDVRQQHAKALDQLRAEQQAMEALRQDMGTSSAMLERERVKSQQAQEQVTQIEVQLLLATQQLEQFKLEGEAAQTQLQRGLDTSMVELQEQRVRVQRSEAELERLHEQHQETCAVVDQQQAKLQEQEQATAQLQAQLKGVQQLAAAAATDLQTVLREQEQATAQLQAATATAADLQAKLEQQTEAAAAGAAQLEAKLQEQEAAASAKAAVLAAKLQEHMDAAVSVMASLQNSLDDSYDEQREALDHLDAEHLTAVQLRQEVGAFVALVGQERLRNQKSVEELKVAQSEVARLQHHLEEQSSRMRALEAQLEQGQAQHNAKVSDLQATIQKLSEERIRSRASRTESGAILLPESSMLDGSEASPSPRPQAVAKSVRDMTAQLEKMQLHVAMLQGELLSGHHALSAAESVPSKFDLSQFTSAQHTPLQRNTAENISIRDLARTSSHADIAKQQDVSPSAAGNLAQAMVRSPSKRQGRLPQTPRSTAAGSVGATGVGATGEASLSSGGGAGGVHPPTHNWQARMDHMQKRLEAMRSMASNMQASLHVDEGDDDDDDEGTDELMGGSPPGAPLLMLQPLSTSAAMMASRGVTEDDVLSPGQQQGDRAMMAKEGMATLQETGKMHLTDMADMFQVPLHPIRGTYTTSATPTPRPLNSSSVSPSMPTSARDVPVVADTAAASLNSATATAVVAVAGPQPPHAAGEGWRVSDGSDSWLVDLPPVNQGVVGGGGGGGGVSSHAQMLTLDLTTVGSAVLDQGGASTNRHDLTTVSQSMDEWMLQGEAERFMVDNPLQAAEMRSNPLAQSSTPSSTVQTARASVLDTPNATQHTRTPIASTSVPVVRMSQVINMTPSKLSEVLRWAEDGAQATTTAPTATALTTTLTASSPSATPLPVPTLAPVLSSSHHLQLDTNLPSDIQEILGSPQGSVSQLEWDQSVANTDHKCFPAGAPPQGPQALSGSPSWSLPGPMAGQDQQGQGLGVSVSMSMGTSLPGTSSSPLDGMIQIKSRKQLVHPESPTITYARSKLAADQSRPVAHMSFNLGRSGSTGQFPMDDAPVSPNPFKRGAADQVLRRASNGSPRSQVFPEPQMPRSGSRSQLLRQEDEDRPSLERRGSVDSMTNAPKRGLLETLISAGSSRHSQVVPEESPRALERRLSRRNSSTVHPAPWDDDAVSTVSAASASVASTTASKKTLSERIAGNFNKLTKSLTNRSSKHRASGDDEAPGLLQ